MTQARTRTTRTTTGTPPDTGVNEVRLVGRLSAVPTVVSLPSGDELVSFRVTVAREAGARPRASGPPHQQRSDSVPCSVWVPRLRRSVQSWRPGDVVEVVGAVRCRFYQAGGATRSRVEVEASSARVIRRSSGA